MANYFRPSIRDEFREEMRDFLDENPELMLREPKELMVFATRKLMLEVQTGKEIDDIVTDDLKSYINDMATD